MMRLVGFVALVAACDATPLNAVVRSRCPQVVGARQAASTSAFLDTLGFNIPVNELQRRRIDGATQFEHMQTLGVKHLRGNASMPLELTEQLASALSAAGMRYTFALSLRTDLDTFLPQTRGVAEAVQVASPANDWIGPYSVTELPAATQRWRAQLDQLPPSARPALIGPIIFQAEDAAAVGSLGAWIDLGGFRYTIGHVAPSRSFGGDWEQMALGVSGGKSLAATKASYETARPGAVEQRLSEDVQAKYVVRLFLEGFNRGVVRTHYDNLYDEDCAEGFCINGLIRPDGTPKPSYLAWAAMVKALGKPSQPSEPRALPIALEAPTNVHSLLLTNAEGIYFLALWLEVNGTAGLDQEASVVVQVGSPLRSAEFFDLRQPGAAAKPLNTAESFAVVVSDAPVLLRLTPACF